MSGQVEVSGELGLLGGSVLGLIAGGPTGWPGLWVTTPR